MWISIAGCSQMFWFSLRLYVLVIAVFTVHCSFCCVYVAERTEKVQMGSIKAVVSEPLVDHEEYHMLVCFPETLFTDYISFGFTIQSSWKRHRSWIWSVTMSHCLESLIELLLLIIIIIIELALQLWIISLFYTILLSPSATKMETAKLWRSCRLLLPGVFAK